jgi:NCAIR mutase (PurE)-related protein
MDVRMDWEREARTGVTEAVLCAGKSDDQIRQIVELAHAERRRLLFTRLEAARWTEFDVALRGLLDYDPVSRTAVLGGLLPPVASDIGIIAAGTSDMPVALEAKRTLAFAGHEATVIADVGVAALWRLVDRREELARFRIIIAVAGMEGALFSVIAGLVKAPVIAVPTSAAGYGVAAGGAAALTSALASCAPGVVTVNIDNGFGAASAALKIAAAHSLLIGRTWTDCPEATN